MRPALRHLARAVDLARAGRPGSARLAVAEALALAPADGVVQLAAAHLLHVTRDYQRGLAALAAARRLLPAAAPRVLRRAAACAEALGWEREVAAAVLAGRALTPRDPAWDALELAMHRRGGDDVRALAAADRAAARAPRWVALQLERAGILARLGRDHDARAAVLEAMSLRTADARPPRCEAARVLTRAGDFQAAAAHWHAAHALDPSACDAPAALADLALRTGDLAAARAWTARITTSAPDGAAAAAFLHGLMAMSEGTCPEALAHFDAALAAGERAGPLLGRAEALLRLGRAAEAHAAVTRACAAADELLPAAWLLRLLLVARADPERRPRPQHTEEIADLLREQGLAAALSQTTLGTIAAAVETALARMPGDRSFAPCWRDGAVLRPLATYTGPRHAARAALLRIRSAPEADALAGFDPVLARFPASSLPLCHRGELRLWLGDVAGARADLEAALAIAPHTRWAYIGLTMAAILDGDDERALAEDARGTAVMASEGPAAHVHRGEALRRLGRTTAAIAALQRAVDLHPGRVAARLDLGLAFGTAGDLAGQHAAFTRVRDRCPGLVSDAAAELGVIAWPDPDQPVPPDTERRLLAHALTMLRGNRSSSCVTYFTAAGQLRIAQDGAPPDRGPNAADAADLARALALITA